MMTFFPVTPRHCVSAGLPILVGSGFDSARLRNQDPGFLWPSFFFIFGSGSNRDPQPCLSVCLSLSISKKITFIRLSLSLFIYSSRCSVCDSYSIQSNLRLFIIVFLFIYIVKIILLYRMSMKSCLIFLACLLHIENWSSFLGHTVFPRSPVHFFKK